MPKAPFTVTDPRGYEITCPVSTWKHIIEHEVMIGNEQAVIDTIANPDMGIYESSTFSTRQVYFSTNKNASYKVRYNKVVVDIKKKRVWSAWPQPDVKGGIGKRVY